MTSILLPNIANANFTFIWHLFQPHKQIPAHSYVSSSASFRLNLCFLLVFRLFGAQLFRFSKFGTSRNNNDRLEILNEFYLVLLRFCAFRSFFPLFWFVQSKSSNIVCLCLKHLKNASSCETPTLVGIFGSAATKKKWEKTPSKSAFCCFVTPLTDVAAVHVQTKFKVSNTQTKR